jgi:hypothetical protein
MVKTEADIATDWLPRYSSTLLEEFGQQILQAGVDSLCQLINQGLTVKPLRF